MGDITRNLSRYEFMCRCCGWSDPHPALCFGVQEMVDRLEARAVIITSGSRCDKHAAYLVRTIGAAEKSQHRKQKHKGGYTCAADCIFLGVPLPRVVAAVEKVSVFTLGGVGLYLDQREGKTDRVHLDVRGYRARWGFVDGRKTSFALAFEAMNERLAL